MIKELLLNTLIVLMPVFVYQLLHLERHKESIGISKWLLGLLCGLASILCMMFPIVSGPDFLWDLRWVPFVIAVLYGGLQGGIVAGLFISVYRAYVDFNLAFFLTVLVAIVLLGLLLLARPMFKSLSPAKRLLAGTTLLLCSYIIVMLSIWYYFYEIHNLAFFFQQIPGFLFLAGFCNIIAGLCNMILFERLHENARMQEEFSKAEKLNVISELAASIAHEVRNPLTVVRGFIQLTKEQIDDPHKAFMETAISELDRAESIISDYLNFAKPKSVCTEKLHISQEINLLIELVQSYANLKGVEMRTEIESGLFIIGDQLQFKQIILNLVKNAIEATGKNGSVAVKAYKQKGLIYIHVIDTGEGMQPEQLQKLGKPYYSTKEKGTGLGLMVTFRLVEEYNGRLSFESELGKGTIATVRFPCGALD